MSALPSAIARPLARWIPQTRRDLRLASGLVLFTYVTLHLSCHALGLGLSGQEKSDVIEYLKSLPEAK